LREKACTLPLLDLKQFLNEWLAQYVQLDDDPTPDRQATYPLREASVNVTDVPGRPGVYRAVLFVGPRFQLEEPTPSLRLIVETLA
jgi:type VI secretion system protein ImpC